MRKQTFFLILILVASAWSARAILPPDAEFREPEIRAQKIRFRQEYEKRLEVRRDFAIQKYKETEALIHIPPWDRDSAAKNKTADGQVGAVKTSVEKSATKGKNRLFISIVLLILIGSAVGYAKHATREVDQ